MRRHPGNPRVQTGRAPRVRAIARAHRRRSRRTPPRALAFYRSILLRASAEAPSSDGASFAGARPTRQRGPRGLRASPRRPRGSGAPRARRPRAAARRPTTRSTRRPLRARCARSRRESVPYATSRVRTCLKTNSRSPARVEDTCETTNSRSSSRPRSSSRRSPRRRAGSSPVPSRRRGRPPPPTAARVAPRAGSRSMRAASTP